MFIILFLAVLGVLILSHEFGHFIVAKKSGMRVDEFAFGFPPRLFKFKKGETLYSINLIPFGGYVKIHGEEGEGEEDPRSFASKPISARAAVIIAGVFFNILLAWLLLSVGYSLGLPGSVGAAPKGADIRDEKIVILQVQSGTPAEAAGFKLGDELVGFKEVEEVQSFISENGGSEIEITYKRGAESFSVNVVPSVEAEKGKGALGIAMDKVGIIKTPAYLSIWEGLKTTANLTIAVASAIFFFIADSIRGLVGINQIIGPVGIVSAAGAMTEMGFSYLLGFMALLSINLAIINIIPFPALDGGRLVFLIIEKIKGSPVSQRFSSMAHSIGLILLLILMAIITYNDILRLV